MSSVVEIALVALGPLEQGPVEHAGTSTLAVARTHARHRKLAGMSLGSVDQGLGSE